MRWRTAHKRKRAPRKPRKLVSAPQVFFRFSCNAEAARYEFIKAQRAIEGLSAGLIAFAVATQRANK